MFFLPCLLLAMVSPLAIRRAAGERLDRIGRTAGQLYAISTTGSIAGTLATAFWLIPLMSLDGLVVGIGLLLFATSLLALALPTPTTTGADDPSTRLSSHVARRAPSLGLVIVAASIVLGTALGVWTLLGPTTRSASVPAGERVILQQDTQYHRLYVTEDAEERHLRFDRSHQTAMYLDDPYQTSFRYPGYMHLALALKPDARRVLVIGLGGGSIIKRMWRDYPQMEIDVAEIDPVVVDVAYRYFALPEDARIQVAPEDGRRFLRGTTRTYDIIVLDAYHADALPSHLTTREFFAEAKAHLNPGGVLAYNVIGSVEGSRSKLFRSLYKTVGGVWRTAWVFPIGIGADRSVATNRNIIVLATDSRSSAEELTARIDNRVGGRVSVPGFADFDEDLWTTSIEIGDVPLLTDAHAPTDALIEVE